MGMIGYGVQVSSGIFIYYDLEYLIIISNLWGKYIGEGKFWRICIYCRSCLKLEKFETDKIWLIIKCDDRTVLFVF